MKQLKQILKDLMPFIAPFKKFFIFSIFFIVLASTMTVVAPYVEGMITTYLLSVVSKNGAINFQYILQLIAVLLGIYITGSGSRILYQFILTEAIQNMMKDLRQAINVKIHKLPVSYFDKHTTGDLMSRMASDVETVSNALQQSLAVFVSSILMLLFAIGAMYAINVKLALIVTLILPFTLVYGKFIVKKSQPRYQNLQNALGDLNGVIQEKYSGYKEIMLFDKQEDSIEEFMAVNQNLCNQSFMSQFVSGMLTPGINLITYLCIGVVVYLGGLDVLAGVMLVGQLQAFIRYIWQVSDPLNQMSDLIQILQAAVASLVRIFEVLDATEELPDRKQPKTIADVHGSVQMKDVAFGYTPDTILLHDLSVDIKSGQMVAIVGPTGVGKTTLINLLMRFYDVNGGAICVDGVDIRDLARDDLRSMFGMVLQDTWLFKGTIKENIAYGVDHATDEQIEEAAKIANAHHFIRTLPDGYNMVINEEGNNISQGEKQLLTIARAIVADPKIMILDEATSSVDTRLEQMLQEAMSKIMEGRTSFVIAHRLSTIKNADVILVMKDGNIVEQGNHETLLAKKGYYEQLYNAQFAE
ncbi:MULTISPECIES: ABC transporter ATP-binding protein [unclassified Breznakia]|uniref:ABC transporter ATP-binding protein n=1 Tax=unclassified Breznakia TaxID=2623764 RepID=UPI002473CC5D|nr:MULTISPECIES: ABC transporter ATP-binding protein [unclassified Breznakia]MDH6366805.1 ATP-binding cassette subfamily B multidrug efflux pump [Breznakia sp. PH1-1]MDH6403808.1 ATP-binding cassette subfamily B multidrug efflux pump [Breznakia sp. PF1-11]MDH6411517.1 ATP-binding cassette subfamily B multidrug efflux pump [Breznakia sp. PFB1-11]MDH6413881.1 ATP-binding cassette subfamily B multidrug efflux pump [Breznakia sp. PFB1-14]MDH6416310.1 ATP-binding cassette subfamily B multidrug effl